MVETIYVPSGWERITIGEVVARSQYGTSAPSGDAGSIPVVGMKDMVGGRVKIDSLARITLSAHEANNLSLQPGDLLLNRTNSPELVGKVAIWDHDTPATFASYLVRFELDRSRANPRFINQLLNTEDAQTQLKQLATRGVSQANINPTVFKAHFWLNLPPMDQQDRIVAITDECDRVITATDALIEAKRKRKRALSRQLFGDVHNPFAVLGASLGDIANIRYGSAVDATAYQRDGLAWVVGTQGLMGRTMAGQHVGPAIVLGRKGTLNKPFFVPLGQSFSAIDTTFIVTADSHLRALFQYLKYVDLAKLNEASGVPSVAADTLRSLPIPRLSLGQADVLDAADQEIEILKAQAAALRLQKRGLMQKLLSGEWLARPSPRAATT
jgi:type I restriction enzyme S subunit